MLLQLSDKKGKEEEHSMWKIPKKHNLLNTKSVSSHFASAELRSEKVAMTKNYISL